MDWSPVPFVSELQARAEQPGAPCRYTAFHWAGPSLRNGLGIFFRASQQRGHCRNHVDMGMGHMHVHLSWNHESNGYGSIPIHTIFKGMNMHLPAILMFTRGIGFWPIPKCHQTIWNLQTSCPFIQCWDGLPSQGLTVLLPQPWSVHWQKLPVLHSIPYQIGLLGIQECIAIV